MERKLAAILAADVVGYSRLMAADEAGTLAKLQAILREVFEPKIESYGGRLVKLMGDGLLADFASTVNAVTCALEIQQTLSDREASQQADTRLMFRMGINLGDIIIEGDDIFGDGVNIAARLETLSEPGGICISSIVHESIGNSIEAGFSDDGLHEVKNIERPIRVFRWSSVPASHATPARHPSALREKPSIAVLAFTNMSGDPEQEYFSDGISEDIITELSRFQDLFVIARNSSFVYKGKSVKVQDIGTDLGVDYVVEGSVRKAGKRLRITAQLIEAATGNHIWAERYDRELEDIFELQDEITQTIVTVLPFRLRSVLAENARRKSSEDLTVIDFFMRARWLFDKTSGQARDQVLELLSSAVKANPNFAPAYALLARVHSYSVYTFSPLGADPTIAAVEYIERALALGEGDHFVHTEAASVYLTCGMHELAQLHADRSIALNPNDVSGLLVRGFIASYSGNHRKGVELLKQALAHNPLAPDHDYEVLAESYYLLGDYEKAVELYQRWRNPPVHTYTHLAACYAQLDRMEDARHAAKTFKEAHPKDSDFSFYAAAHARLCKQPEDAERWLQGYRKAGLID